MIGGNTALPQFNLEAAKQALPTNVLGKWTLAIT